MFKKYTKGLLEKEVIASSSENKIPSVSPFLTKGTFYEQKTPLSPSLEEERENHTLAKPSSEEPETVIGEKVSIKGSLSFETLLRIDGSFEGELLSEGKLIVGPKGSVKANISLQEAFISGKVEGNISVKERLVLRGRAEVKGNITAPLLSVDEGVSILGELQVASLPQEESAEQNVIE